MINFLHSYLPQPILFQFGFLQIHWYGIFVVFAAVLGLLVVLKLAKRFSISSDEVYNLGFYLLIFGLLGARAYAVFLDWQFYLSQPLEILAVWHGGLAIHGAIFFGILTLFIYTHPLTRSRFIGTTLSPKGPREIGSFWLWADLIAPALALGQAIGRFGNYFNQEVFGKPTNLPWGIPISFANRPLEYLNFQYFHPTFLYESILDFCNFLILLVLFYKLKNKKSGVIFLVYLIIYSLIRIGLEFLRTDQTMIILGIRLPILVSLVVIIFSLLFLIKKFKPKAV
ncbi:MAG: prolipoprotein diacylglyceryl transferase [Candidatus Buchananbacteria bacterium]